MVVEFTDLDLASSVAGNYFMEKALWRSYGLSHEISEFVINCFLSVEKFIFCEIPGVLLHRLERNRFGSHFRFLVLLFPENNIFFHGGLIEDEIR
jgi:hypothetical protein